MTQPASKRLVTEAALAEELEAADATARAAFGLADFTAGRTITPLPGLLSNLNAQNAISFNQDNVTTHNGVQYVAWTNSARQPIIAKRTLPRGDWQTYDLTNVAGNPLDAPMVYDLHNNLAVAVDTDGYLHISGNMHAVGLNYIRSVNPGDITAWTAPGMVGTEEASVTYPQFVRGKSNELLFFYRDGLSGAGDTIVNAYNTTTKTWARRSKPFLGGTSSAYLNHIAVHTDGTLHLFFNWRDTGAVDTNHDICHVKTTDNGATWLDQAGAVQTLPMTPASAPIVVAGFNGIVNQNGADVDSLGRPHSLWWVRMGGTGNTQLLHVWHNGTAWQQTVEDDLGVGVTGTGALSSYNQARPSVFCYGQRTFALYIRETVGSTARRLLRVKDITPTSYALTPVRLPEFTLADVDLVNYEPTFDTRAIRERGELNMLITPGAAADLDDTWGAVLTQDLTQLEYASSSRTNGPRQPETLWINPERFVIGGGTPVLASTAGDGLAAWLMDAATSEVLYATFPIPSHWRTFSVDVLWASTTSATGNAVFNFRYAFRIPGQAVATDINAAQKVGAANGTNIIVVTNMTSGFVNPATDALMRANIRRVGADASDTLAVDAAFLGLMLRRTT